MSTHLPNSFSPVLVGVVLGVSGRKHCDIPAPSADGDTLQERAFSPLTFLF